jgi:hypothetical protein
MKWVTREKVKVDRVIKGADRQNELLVSNDIDPTSRR